MKAILLLLKLVHLLAQQAEAKERIKQARFKRQAAQRAALLRVEAERAHVKARALDSQAAEANAAATIGSNAINEAERQAASLRASLDHVVGRQ